MLAGFGAAEVCASALLYFDVGARINQLGVILAIGGFLMLPAALYAFARQQRFPRES